MKRANQWLARFFCERICYGFRLKLYLIIEMLNPEYQKRKKLLYVPGMISLLGVPLLFVYFSWLRISEIPHYQTMEVNWYNEAIMSKIKWWSKLPYRQYLNLTLTGNIDSDEVRIAFGELYAKEIHANRDTIHGVFFHFSDRSKYSEFVRVFDEWNINCFRCYCASDDGIRIYYVPESIRSTIYKPIPL